VPGIAFMPEAPYGSSNCWLTCITIAPGLFGATSEEVRMVLDAENIEARPLWKPMHLQPVFREQPMCGGAVSEALFETGLCLPSGSALGADEQRRIVDIILSVGGRGVADRKAVAHA
jgi:pyridoxal phosphate-dependent aminotransferase EpsN